VLEAYEDARTVIITQAVAVTKSEGRVSNIGSTTMVVEKVFKGNRKPGDKLVFRQGGGAACTWSFDEKSVGKRFLFYLNDNDASEPVTAITCGRSNQLEYAADDLLYLENMARRRGKTRISGTLSFYQGSPVQGEQPTYKFLVGKKVRIIGPKKTYALTTNNDGVYEIYDLPPGKYALEAEIPTGWRLNWVSSSGSESLPPILRGINQSEEKSWRAEVVLGARKHAYFDFAYEVDNAIRGMLIDPEGRPLDGACIDPIPVGWKKPPHCVGLECLPSCARTSGFIMTKRCTADGGKFMIDAIPAGSYLLAVNCDGKISSREPFQTFYYPNVFDREKATVITIGEGETIKGLVIQAPQTEETITVEGVVLYSDGEPAVHEYVGFKPEKSDLPVEGYARAVTDSAGRFSIKILKNLRGTLAGEILVYGGKYENCRKIEQMIRDTGEWAFNVRTNSVELSADRNLFNVELRYSFPACKKASPR
jgi:hypothetical protein